MIGRDHHEISGRGPLRQDRGHTIDVRLADVREALGLREGGEPSYGDERGKRHARKRSRRPESDETVEAHGTEGEKGREVPGVRRDSRSLQKEDVQEHGDTQGRPQEGHSLDIAHAVLSGADAHAIDARDHAGGQTSEPQREEEPRRCGQGSAELLDDLTDPQRAHLHVENRPGRLHALGVDEQRGHGGESRHEDRGRAPQAAKAEGRDEPAGAQGADQDRAQVRALDRRRRSQRRQRHRATRRVPCRS